MSFVVSFSQKLSMASRLYAPGDGFSVWFLWRRPRGTLPSGSTTSSSFSSSSISSGDRVDSRLSMSGSSLTCRRYLATLDILAKWAAALVGLQGLAGWDGRAGVDAADPRWSGPRLPHPACAGAQVWSGSCSLPSPGLVDPGCSRQRPIRPHDGPAPGGAANPRVGAGLLAVRAV